VGDKHSSSPNVRKFAELCSIIGGTYANQWGAHETYQSKTRIKKLT
jgi:hypothetical protein